MVNTNPEFESLTSAAVRWSLNPKTLRRAIDAGDLPARRLNRAIRVKRSDVDSLFTQMVPET